VNKQRQKCVDAKARIPRSVQNSDEQSEQEYNEAEVNKCAREEMASVEDEVQWNGDKAHGDEHVSGSRPH